MLVGVSGREKKRSPVRIHSLVLQIHRSTEAEGDSELGTWQSHLLRQVWSAQVVGSLGDVSEGLSPLSRHERMKESRTINTAAS